MKGYTIVSFTTIKGMGALTAVDPAIFMELGTTKADLCDAIKKALLLSETYGEVDRATKKKSCYWELTGIKNFKTFCKKNKAVEISDFGDGLNVYNLTIDEMYGLFTHSENENDRKDFGNCEDYDLVTESVCSFLNSEALNKDDTENRSFTTVGQAVVAYLQPNDDLEYCGDGGTDAYALYRETDTENFIVFLIDNGYEAFDEEVK